MSTNLKSKLINIIYIIIVLNLKYLNSQYTEDCGKTFSCFLNPANCVNDECITIVKWRDVGDSFNFIITSNSTLISGFERYTAIGFSYDQYMGEDSVSLCRIQGTKSGVESYYNKEKLTPDVINNFERSLGLTNIKSSLNQTYLICNFTRLKSIKNVNEYYDLNYPYYLLVVYGYIDSLGSPKFHGGNFYSSQSRIDFRLNNMIYSPYTYNEIVLNGNFVNGEFNLKWADTQSSTHFEFSTLVSNSDNIWSAFGFSSDQNMGNDDVCLCKTFNNKSSIEHYYNIGNEAPVLLVPSEPSKGFSNMKVSFENGVLKCSFTRLKSYPNVPNYFDLNNNYYLLTSYGEIDPSNGKILKHKIAYSSSQKIDFKSSNKYVEKSKFEFDEKVAKAKAHGCLMVLAWIFFASSGIVIARYYKYILWHKNICGLKYWYFLHRPIMIFVFLLSIAAFLIILSKLNWKWVEVEDRLEFTHSIFGIVAIGLSFLQIFVGFLRPQNNHPRRFLFNYFHRFVGASTFIFSIVCMFLGVLMEEMNLGRVGWGLMIGWSIWCLIMPIIIEIFKLLFKVKENKYQVDKNSIKSNGPYKNTYKKIFEKLKSIMLVLHLFVAFSFTIALIIVIAIAEEDRFP